MRKKGTDGRWTVETPHKLFDYIREMYSLKTDSQLAHILNTRTPMISKVRSGAIRITPALIIAVHEQTNIPIAKIKEMCK